MKPRTTQFLLMHCPVAVVEELNKLSRQNYLTRTEFLIIALRTMAEYLEESGSQVREGLQHRLITVPGDFDDSEEDDENVLLAAEEEPDIQYDIAPDAEIDDIPIWADQTRRRHHRSD